MRAECEWVRRNRIRNCQTLNINDGLREDIYKLPMQEQNQQAIVIDKFDGESFSLQTFPKPKPKAGQLLIQIHASTINPSDVLSLSGKHGDKELPAVAGHEGTGRVIEANGEDLQSWVGKRVTFASENGSWCEYTTVTPFTCLEIDDDVDIQSAASGFVNPLTVTGFIDVLKSRGHKGIIHTAASSSLGKMLNKLCKEEGIPLLGLVRRQESADLMVSEGITDTLVTSGEWAPKLKELIEKKGYDCLFDCLGGGPTLDTILQSLPPKTGVYVYGVLQNKPLTVSNTQLVVIGLNIHGFFLPNWWMSTSEQTRKKVREVHSKHLKGPLSSTTGKKVSLKEIKEGIEYSQKNPSEGKVLVEIKSK